MADAVEPEIETAAQLTAEDLTKLPAELMCRLKINSEGARFEFRNVLVGTQLLFSLELKIGWAKFKLGGRWAEGQMGRWADGQMGRRAEEKRARRPIGQSSTGVV